MGRDCFGIPERKRLNLEEFELNPFVLKPGQDIESARTAPDPKSQESIGKTEEHPRRMDLDVTEPWVFFSTEERSLGALADTLVVHRAGGVGIEEIFSLVATEQSLTPCIGFGLQPPEIWGLVGRRRRILGAGSTKERDKTKNERKHGHLLCSEVSNSSF